MQEKDDEHCLFDIKTKQYNTKKNKKIYIYVRVTPINTLNNF